MRVIGAANSVLAKTRTLYSSRLSESDFRAMLSMTTLTELTDFLKNSTHYSDAISSFSSSVPYRGQFLFLLKSELLREIKLISRYENAIGCGAYKLFMFRNDCQQIVRRLQTLSEEIDEFYVNDIPEEYSGFSILDRNALAAADTVEGIRALIKGTELETIIPDSYSQSAGGPGLVDVDANIHLLLRKKLIDNAGKDKNLYATYAYCMDCEGLIYAYRIKRGGGGNDALLRCFIGPEPTLLTPPQIKSLLSCTDADSLADAVRQTAYSELFTDGSDPAAMCRRMQVQKAAERFSKTAKEAEAVFCFTVLRDAEINDIINIFEGIRCGVSPELVKNYVYSYRL